MPKEYIKNLTIKSVELLDEKTSLDASGFIENVKTKMADLFDEKEPFDPRNLNDPIALQTQWSPMTSSGSNFKTHELISTGFSRLEFKATKWAKGFSSIFVAVGIWLILHIEYSAFPFNEYLNLCQSFIDIFLSNNTFESLYKQFQNLYKFSHLFDILSVLFGVLFSLIGSKLFYSYTLPIIFDKSKGAYWKSRRKLNSVYNNHDLDDYVDLNQIHALQLLAEYHQSSEDPYYSYQLNLILVNADRINIIGHGDQEALQNDAMELSDFLGKPLWDAS